MVTDVCGVAMLGMHATHPTVSCFMLASLFPVACVPGHFVINSYQRPWWLPVVAELRACKVSSDEALQVLAWYNAFLFVYVSEMHLSVSSSSDDSGASFSNRPCIHLNCLV